MKDLKIANKMIGEGHPTFIVAEVGINHNGDIDIVKQLIDAAIMAGCDAVKFQKKTPELCVPEDQKNKSKETPWGSMTYLEYKKKMELSADDYTTIETYCAEKGIIWFASVWDIPSVDFLEHSDIPCYKIPSACLTDIGLLKRVRKTKKPVILSTGMSTLEQIDKAVEVLGKDKLILMHCNSSYPSKDEELNLKCIQTLKKRYGVPVGYSGHELGLFASAVSVLLGADIIERHITLERTMWGTDHAASVEPYGFKRLVRDIRRINPILGDGVKKVFDSEKEVMEKLRKIK